MKYLFILLPLFSFSGKSAGQNIIPNPNFAIDSACPWSASQMNYCSHWRQATLGTSDYYNACDAGGSAGVPQNMVGYQASNSGTYAGFYTYAGEYDVVPDYKEYISNTFSALIPGATYKVTILVSLADSAFYASNGIGVYFSTVPVNYYTLTTLAVTPQVDYSGYGVINDKINWVTLTENFIPDSSYTNLVIGNFKNNSAVTLVPCASHGNDTDAYYYVDSVSVEEISGPTFTGNITTAPAANVYPNPFTDFTVLNFAYVAGEYYKINIYNMYGCLCRSMDGIDKGEVKIDRGSLANGFYYYQLFDNSGLIASGKLIAR